jgi:cytochrome c
MAFYKILQPFSPVLNRTLCGFRRINFKLFRCVMHKSSSWLLIAAALVTVTAPSRAWEGDPIRGRALFGEQCTLCHTEAGEGGLGPDLRGVAGRKAASTDFAYSPALMATGWAWDDSNLDRFLENPAAVVPGSVMPFSVPNLTERADIIAYLKSLK